MVEDHDMIIGLQDRIPIDHTGTAITHHASEGHVCRELEFTYRLSDDTRVTASYELDDLGIADEGEAGHLPRLLS